MLIHFNSNSITHQSHGVNCLNIDSPFRMYNTVCVEFNSTLLSDRQEELINSVCTHNITTTYKLMTLLYLEIAEKLFIRDKIITLLTLSNISITSEYELVC